MCARQVAHLAQTLGRDAAEQKQRLEIGRCPFLVVPGPLHRPSGLVGVGGQAVPSQRKAERRTDSSCHPGVIEKYEGVPRVEENGSELRMRLAAQRKRSNAPRLSMASRASGS